VVVDGLEVVLGWVVVVVTGFTDVVEVAPGRRVVVLDPPTVELGRGDWMVPVVPIEAVVVGTGSRVERVGMVVAGDLEMTMLSLGARVF
jgi:hypothetical protein